MTFDVVFKNAEMAKSLIYILERRFPEKTFRYNTAFNTIETIDDSNSDEIKQIILDFSQKASSLASKIQSKILWQSQNNIPLEGDVEDEVFSSNVPGAFLLTGQIPKIIQRLDSILVNWLQSLHAEEVSIPSLIQSDDLIQAQVFDRERHQISILRQHNNQDCDVCLSPAACLPLYPIIGKHRALITEKIFTARCQVHRYENGVFGKDHTLSRLWEFHVREIVGFGDAAFEQNVRNMIIEFIKNIAEVFDIPSAITTASDLFFHSEHSAYALHQLSFKTKLEFRVNIAGADMSVASINSHGRHFIEKFSIKTSENCGSFCIGFGLERLALAIALALKNTNSNEQLWTILEERVLGKVS